MNWVGGVRRRVLVKEEERRRQNQFFAFHASSAKHRQSSSHASSSSNRLLQAGQCLGSSREGLQRLSHASRPKPGTYYYQRSEEVVCERIHQGASSTSVTSQRNYTLNGRVLKSAADRSNTHSGERVDKSLESSRQESSSSTTTSNSLQIKTASIHGPYSKYLLELEMRGIENALKKKLDSKKKSHVQDQKAARQNSIQEKQSVQCTVRDRKREECKIRQGEDRCLDSRGNCYKKVEKSQEMLFTIDDKVATKRGKRDETRISRDVHVKGRMNKKSLNNCDKMEKKDLNDPQPQKQNNEDKSRISKSRRKRLEGQGTDSKSDNAADIARVISSKKYKTVDLADKKESDGSTKVASDCEVINDRSNEGKRNFPNVGVKEDPKSIKRRKINMNLKHSMRDGASRHSVSFQLTSSSLLAGAPRVRKLLSLSPDRHKGCIWAPLHIPQEKRNEPEAEKSQCDMKKGSARKEASNTVEQKGNICPPEQKSLNSTQKRKQERENIRLSLLIGCNSKITTNQHKAQEAIPRESVDDEYSQTGSGSKVTETIEQKHKAPRKLNERLVHLVQESKIPEQASPCTAHLYEENADSAGQKAFSKGNERNLVQLPHTSSTQNRPKLSAFTRNIVTIENGLSFARERKDKTPYLDRCSSTPWNTTVDGGALNTSGGNSSKSSKTPTDPNFERTFDDPLGSSQEGAVIHVPSDDDIKEVDSLSKEQDDRVDIESNIPENPCYPTDDRSKHQPSNPVDQESLEAQFTGGERYCHYGKPPDHRSNSSYGQTLCRYETCTALVQQNLQSGINRESASLDSSRDPGLLSKETPYEHILDDIPNAVTLMQVTSPTRCFENESKAPVAVKSERVSSLCSSRELSIPEFREREGLPTPVYDPCRVASTNCTKEQETMILREKGSEAQACNEDRIGPLPGSYSSKRLSVEEIRSRITHKNSASVREQKTCTEGLCSLQGESDGENVVCKTLPTLNNIRESETLLNSVKHNDQAFDNEGVSVSNSVDLRFSSSSVTKGNDKFLPLDEKQSYFYDRSKDFLLAPIVSYKNSFQEAHLIERAIHLNVEESYASFAIDRRLQPSSWICDYSRHSWQLSNRESVRRMQDDPSNKLSPSRNKLQKLESEIFYEEKTPAWNCVAENHMLQTAIYRNPHPQSLDDDKDYPGEFGRECKAELFAEVIAKRDLPRQLLNSCPSKMNLKDHLAGSESKGEKELAINRYPREGSRFSLPESHDCHERDVSADDCSYQQEFNSHNFQQEYNSVTSTTSYEKSCLEVAANKQNVKYGYCEESRSVLHVDSPLSRQFNNPIDKDVTVKSFVVHANLAKGQQCNGTIALGTDLAGDEVLEEKRQTTSAAQHPDAAEFVSSTQNPIVRGSVPENPCMRDDSRGRRTEMKPASQRALGTSNSSSSPSLIENAIFSSSSDVVLSSSHCRDLGNVRQQRVNLVQATQQFREVMDLSDDDLESWDGATQPSQGTSQDVTQLEKPKASDLINLYSMSERRKSQLKETVGESSKGHTPDSAENTSCHESSPQNHR